MHIAGNLSALQVCRLRFHMKDQYWWNLFALAAYISSNRIYIRTSFFHLDVLLDKDLEYFRDSIGFLLLLTGLGSAFSGIECRLLLLITEGYGLIVCCWMVCRTQTLYRKKKKQPHNRPGVAQRAPRLHDIRHAKVVRLSASRTGCLYLQECSWYSFSLGAESTPGPWNGWKEICHWKIQWHHRESIPGPSD
jgi:hypothetical protein